MNSPDYNNRIFTVGDEFVDNCWAELFFPRNDVQSFINRVWRSRKKSFRNVLRTQKYESFVQEFPPSSLKYLILIVVVQLVLDHEVVQVSHCFYRKSNSLWRFRIIHRHLSKYPYFVNFVWLHNGCHYLLSLARVSRRDCSWAGVTLKSEWSV